jgi:hypothetical protein
MRSRYATGTDVEDVPLSCHDTVVELSDTLWIVWKQMLTTWATTPNWTVVIASSRSMLVMVPLRFLLKTKLVVMCRGQILLHTIGRT